MAIRLMRGRRRAALATLLSILPALVHPGVARADALTAAQELVREAHAHETAREYDVALRRYAQALELDPTLGDAYLGLGALRLQMGDTREAERVYDAGLSHVAPFPEAWLGRGRARRAMGELREADADVEAYAAKVDDAGALRLLASWYADEGRPIAQLATWRRLLTRAERTDDPPAHKEARLTVHALELIVGTADPVHAPPGDAHASTVRRALARIEARR